MAKLHRTRRIRNERWYCTWDVVGLWMLNGAQINMLGASRDARGNRWWARWGRLLWRYPLGVCRVEWTWPLSLAASVAFVCSVIWLREPTPHVVTLLTTLMLLTWLATLRTPVLATARNARCRMMERAGRVPSSNSTELHAMALRLQDRRDWWQSQKKPWRLTDHAHTYDTWYWVVGMTSMLILVLSHFTQALHIISWPIGILLWPSVALCTMFGLRRPYSMLRRTIEDCQQSCCPDCRYPLAGIPDAIDPALLNGTHTGPARCAECGTHWPLVPPPIPGN